MYIGRFVVVGPELAAYRVSSRSFPNRQVVARDDQLTVTPTPDAPESDNPYISYNCVRPADGGQSAVVGNGSHVDPIAEKLDLGYPARDALAESLLALDYEKDDYDTPRVAGVVAGRTAGEGSEAGERDRSAYIGTVRKDALLVREVSEPTLVATYELDTPTDFDFDAATATAAADDAYELDFEHAVCAAGVRVGDDGVETAIRNGD
ncbi:IMP cyclohydrolase [Salinirubrum litoreum]|uniref:IMP cyclohydrolase n=1 Tax=Salinirubrum litoreum TaxID=1126234 RepID=A0ABD5RDT5_9EURY|nr:IMP cyclohydrolase [Salinirubrum litoreum]